MMPYDLHMDDLEREKQIAEEDILFVQGKPRPYDLVIFDVDGTLVSTQSGKEFREGAADWCILPRRAEVLHEIQAQGVKTALASNQGGVAFGYMQETDIVRELCLLADALGIDRNAAYYCPDHPKATIDRYKQDSPLRKPKPGMLLTAMGYASVRPERTLMVGDRPEDEQAAQAARCAFMHADRFFAEPRNTEHEWHNHEDGGKTWRSCRRCGTIGSLYEDVTTPCDGRMDPFIAAQVTDLEQQVIALNEEILAAKRLG